MKISTGGPEGSPSSLLLPPPMPLPSKTPKGATGGWCGQGMGPFSPQPTPSGPLRAFSKTHSLAAPKSPRAPSHCPLHRGRSPAAGQPLRLFSSPCPCQSSLWVRAFQTWESPQTAGGLILFFTSKLLIKSSQIPPPCCLQLPFCCTQRGGCSICLSCSPPCSQYGYRQPSTCKTTGLLTLARPTEGYFCPHIASSASNIVVI